jgi:hypothetical protein
MKPLRRILRWRSLRHRLCAGLALLAYLAATLGLPLLAAPVRKGKDGSVPFPCQDHPCGCETAEQCWRGCCCFTPEERWAWARAHNVQPPDYAVKPANEGQTTSSSEPAEEDSAEPTCCCCGDGQPASSKKPKPCCGGKEDESASSQKTPEASRRTLGWASGIAALKCRGLATLWITSGAVIVPEQPLAWCSGHTVGIWLPSMHDTPLLQPSTPPDPPPRFSPA